ncbi:MAG: alpha-E domain-containing protein [Chitinophagaceae bacterium]|nr:alpha-E domain-containing protein [Chitinophagaceae bacterium]
MLSRIADSLFWLSRYMERNDCLIRMVRTHYILDFDAGSHSTFTWTDLMQLFASPLTGEQRLKGEKNGRCPYIFDFGKIKLQLGAYW